MLDLLTSLTDKCLVVAERAQRHDPLPAAGDGAAVCARSAAGEWRRRHWRDRHLAYFLAVAKAAEPHLTGADQQAWLDRLETEHDNLPLGIDVVVRSGKRLRKRIGAGGRAVPVLVCARIFWRRIRCALRPARA